MIELIVGKKGTGKTKLLMGKACNDIKTIGGNIIYIDKNSKHATELSEGIKLINMSEYKIDNAERFIGFIYGIVSVQNNIDKIFLDNFLSVSHIEDVDEADKFIKELDAISQKCEIDFVISMSFEKDVLTDYLKESVTISL